MFRLLAWLLTLLLLLSIGPVVLLRWMDPPTTAFIIRERLSAGEPGKPRSVQYRWVDGNQISPHIKVAVIASEDQKFPEHYGFDLDSINDALEDRERGRRVRGASTLSQQVAKNMFLWPGQSWIRKGLEAYFTVLIETLWPKRRILEVYVNIAEFGSGVFGVGAASEIFFKKPAARLNAPEAALLAAVLPSPKRMKVRAPSRYVLSRQQWILGQMRGLGGVGLLREIEPPPPKQAKKKS
ncbi:monofunctional biosynthetic peptidoglycan transglycosylase [Steroidobacter agaridevorans]|uniref:Biosynthetic peptidoglycan transglycosylase n=1 Tax=Steroidobacter agaridevorans TaxID=2695856 RepID=A0A829Y9Z6_9GAMM|nr:monofunctional biosynthetic peptidoglycan transglycosylase [Steroidobacter agaridevorans]GFE79546.1 monofunctional biosynthetic peptidoglycan transglycosylase [Steroidobacter agaridevorans]